MLSVKSNLRLEPIARRPAETFMNAHHERGASQPGTLYLGLFWQDRLHGVLAFGAPVVNNAAVMLGLRAYETLELRRMIVDDVPPRNSESRALAVAARLIAGRYPQIKALLTYCGEEEAAMGYRACGWRVIAISRNYSAVVVNGEKMAIKTFHRRFAGGAERRVPHQRVTIPTQKLALGLTEEVRARIATLSARLIRPDDVTAASPSS